MSHKKHTINLLSLKFMIYIIVTGLVFSLVSSSVQIQIEYNRGKDDIDSLNTVIRNSYIESVTNSLFHFNEELLEVQLKGLIQFPAIVYVVLQEHNGRVYEAGDPFSDRQFQNDYPLIFETEHSEKFDLGTLTVYLNLNSYKQAMKKRVLPLLIERIMLVILLSLLNYLITHRIITRHLTKISQYANNNTLDHFEYNFHLDRKQTGLFRPDNFDFLEDSINSMNRRLSEDLVEKNRLMGAINQSRDTIIIMDRHGIIQFANPVFTEDSGLSRSRIIGKKFIDIGREIEEDPLQKPENNVENAIRNGRNWSGRMTHKNREGQIITEDASLFTVSDKKEKISNYIAIIRNITERERLEKEKQIIQEQYYHIQKIQSIEHFAGGIAHDLNNLITPILGFTELLEKQLESTEYKMPLSEIHKAGVRASDLVSQLLSFSRKKNHNIAVTNVNTIIRNFETLLRQSVRKNTTITFNLAEEMKDILADSGQIEQVLMNMIINAKDAMPEGGELLIRTEMYYMDTPSDSNQENMKPGLYAVIIIRDSGSGMDEETKDRIFEPFFSTKGQKGTGLGLATSFSIIKLHNGTIRIQSKEGEGSEFRIFLPIPDSEQ